MKIDMNGVSITLTTEQLAEISRQTKKEFDYKTIKSFEDACDITGESSDLSIFNNINESKRKKHIALHKLEIINKAVNNGWIPNWNSSNEQKYYPYFDMRNEFTFYDTYYTWSNACSVVGSRLCFSSIELSNYVGKTFTELYKDLLC